MHISRKLLDAVAGGSIPPRVLVELAVHHLMELCSVCGEAVTAHREAVTAPVEESQLAETHPRWLQARGERWLEKLSILAPAEQGGSDRGTKEGVRRASPADRLLRGSKECLPGDPEGSRQLAEAALAVLERSPMAARSESQTAQAIALLSNYQRIRGDLVPAERGFREARRRLDLCRVKDALACADVDWLEGALRKRQRRFAESEELLARSALFYEVANDPSGTARALLSLSDAYRVQGDPAAALDAVYRALGSFDHARDPLLFLYARYDLAYNLYSLGRFEEALEHLVFDEDDFVASSDPFLQVHRLWLEAKLGAELADASAEPRFLEVQRLVEGRPLDLAHVALDLALLYFRLGRFDDVKKVAAEAAALFEAQSVHREVLAALLLFREAAFAQRVTADLIRRVTGVLERAKMEPVPAGAAR